jgi:CheY-like chemotaxis protein
MGRFQSFSSRRRTSPNRGAAKNIKMSIFPDKTRYILVLFERTSDLAQIKRILANPFYAYYAVNSMQNAFDLLQHRRIDLVISGVHLENTDSYEFLNRVKADEKLRHIPFVFVTLRRSDVARCVDHGLSLAARALGAAKYLSIDTNSPQMIQAEISSCFAPRPEQEPSEEPQTKEEPRPFWSPTPKTLPPAPGSSYSY